MCVRSVRPFSKRITRFLPRALTSSIRSPSGPRPSFSLRNCVTRAPTSALRSVVAARKMVSPSGIFLFERLGGLGGRKVAPERRALEIALDSGSEAGGLQLRRERGQVDVLAVDARDQERLATPIVDRRRERLRHGARPPRARRLVGGEE